MTDKLEQQWIRKATLIVAADGDGIDLSQLRFKFRVCQSDEESPNTAIIRVYNLAPDTLRKITGRTPVEYTRVVLQAGYENSHYGVIFDGTIKQFRRGKENATDSYLDILAAAGDIEYNLGVCNATVAAGSTPLERARIVAKQMGMELGQTPGLVFGGVLPRGKVLWGMGRTLLRCEAANRGATWSIQDGKIDVVPLDGYLPGEAVVLSALTGMVGIPEQTEQGVRIRCLLNPKLRIGGLVQVDNASINQTSQADLRASGFASRNLDVGQVPFDKYAGVQMLADVTTDGFYRLYVVEYIGDTRGQEWYAELVGLAVDASTGKVLAK
jgi:hypothetical protein